MQISEEEFLKNVSNCQALLKKWWNSEIFIQGKINPIILTNVRTTVWKSEIFTDRKNFVKSTSVNPVISLVKPKLSSNQLLWNFFSKTVTFTRI